MEVIWGVDKVYISILSLVIGLSSMFNMDVYFICSVSVISSSLVWKDLV